MAPSSPVNVIESLESRLAPAGIVTITTGGGTLTITGSADAEHITITDNPATGQWTVGVSALLPDTVFKVDGTVLAGSSFTMAAGKAIKATLGDGADQIDILSTGDGMILSGGLSINTGKGADIVNIGLTNAESLTVLGAVAIDLGDGDDKLTVNASALFAAAVSLKGGLDNDQILFEQGTAHTFQKGLSVDLGKGKDSFILDSDIFWASGGAVSIKGAGLIGEEQIVSLTPLYGSSDGAVNIAIAAGDATITVGLGCGCGAFGSLRLGSGLSISGGAGDDLVDLGGALAVAKAVTIDLKAGDNMTTFLEESSLQTGSFTIKGGLGSDIVDLGESSIIISGALTATLGAGTNILGTGFTNTLSVGSINQTGMTGQDAFLFYGETLIVAGNATFALGAGDTNGVSITATVGAFFGGNFTVTATTGDDVVGFNSFFMRVMGNVSLNLGNGTNSSGAAGGEFEDFTPYGGVVEILGSLVYKGGTGADGFSILSDSFQVGRALQFSGGDGSNELEIAGFDVVLGSLTYQGGKQQDALELGDTDTETSILGAVTVNVGAGLSRVYLSEVEVLGKLSITSASTVADIEDPDADPVDDAVDDVDISASLIFGVTTIKLGAGTSYFTIDDSTFLNSFTADLGAGKDVMELDHYDLGVDPAAMANNWYGAVKINLGLGDDRIVLGSADVSTVLANNFYKNVILDGGVGTNAITDGNTGLLAGATFEKFKLP